jgi:hypothetical protein
MKRILLAGMIAALALGPAMAQETCATKAVDKNGKPGWRRAQQLPEKVQTGGM